MCGIAGAISLDGAPVKDLRARLNVMNRLLAHRGPDGAGVWTSPDETTGLAHRRLAILDLTASGAQPMIGQDGSVVVHNGEVYNYRELRDELAPGWEFRSRTDTEAVLAAHARWGDDAVQHFRGMFAYARWDHRERRLFAARDRFGIKPLYYTVVAGVLYFASEMKALLPFLNQIELNKSSLAEYLTFQFSLSDETLFAGISQVPPAHVLIVEKGEVRIRRYWDVNYDIDWNHTPKYFEERLDQLIHESLELHLRSDVPIGSYVSGGIDSSLIAILSSRHSSNNNQFFHGRFTDYPGYDESGYAEYAARAASGHLNIIDINSTMFQDHIEKVIYHLDTPVAGPGSFPQYEVSALAASKVKVVLGGQGGDEIFGGYARYLVAYLEQCIRAAIDGSYKNGNFVVTLESIIPRLGMLREYKPMLQSLWKEDLFGPLDARYFRLINRSADTKDEIKWDELPNDGIYERFQSEFNKSNVGKEAYFDKMTHFDFKFLLPALLQVEDRMGMAHGLESRVPFLDHPLVEFVATIPADVKFKEGQSKYLLRHCYRDTLPPPLLERRDKMGFPVPLKEWLNSDLKDFVHDIFGSTAAASRGYVDNKRALESVADMGSFSRKFWGLLSLEIWHRQFIDRSADFKNMLGSAQEESRNMH